MLTASLPFGRGSRVTSRGSKTPSQFFFLFTIKFIKKIALLEFPVPVLFA